MRLLLSTAIFVFAGFYLRAQTVLKTSSDSASPKTGVKVTVLNPNGKQPVPYSGHAMRADSVQQALKLAPGNFLRGDFSLYYEYRLSDQFSLEGAAGVTYIDYMYEVIENGARFILDENEGRSVKFYSGFSGRFQVRWYPSRYETAITGYYFAPEISRRSYRMDYLVNTGLISEPHPLRRTFTDFKLQFGFQDADPYERTFWEWYLAAGIRHIDQDHVEGRGPEAEFVHWNYWKPVIGGGIKIGFVL